MGTADVIPVEPTAIGIACTLHSASMEPPHNLGIPDKMLHLAIVSGERADTSVSIGENSS